MCSMDGGGGGGGGGGGCEYIFTACDLFFALNLASFPVAHASSFFSHFHRVSGGLGSWKSSPSLFASRHHSGAIIAITPFHSILDSFWHNTLRTNVLSPRVTWSQSTWVRASRRKVGRRREGLTARCRPRVRCQSVSHSSTVRVRVRCRTTRAASEVMRSLIPMPMRRVASSLWARRNRTDTAVVRGRSILDSPARGRRQEVVEIGYLADLDSR